MNNKFSFGAVLINILKLKNHSTSVSDYDNLISQYLIGAGWDKEDYLTELKKTKILGK